MLRARRRHCWGLPSGIWRGDEWGWCWWADCQAPGKTTVSTALADDTGWSLLRSDEVRRDLGRNRGPVAYGTGGYSDESVAITHREMLARARVALELGESVILDASCRHETWRALARRVAVDTASDLVEIKCEAPSGIAADRIAADRQGDRGLSDATAATLVAMEKDFDY